jgi:hypothetical protein
MTRNNCYIRVNNTEKIISLVFKDKFVTFKLFDIPSLPLHGIY